MKKMFMKHFSNTGMLIFFLFSSYIYASPSIKLVSWSPLTVVADNTQVPLRPYFTSSVTWAAQAKVTNDLKNSIEVTQITWLLYDDDGSDPRDNLYEKVESYTRVVPPKPAEALLDLTSEVGPSNLNKGFDNSNNSFPKIDPDRYDNTLELKTKIVAWTWINLSDGVEHEVQIPAPSTLFLVSTGLASWIGFGRKRLFGKA